MDLELEIAEGAPHPLDHVEDVLHDNDWHFLRMADDELVVDVKGKSGAYKLFFIWQGDMNALQFCCQFDLHISAHNLEAARAALLSMNESLWMGHFDLPAATGAPSFRYAHLMGALESAAMPDSIRDMVDIALAQCERHMSTFMLLADDAALDSGNLSLALMETLGES